jgi:hypothetical protein
MRQGFAARSGRRDGEHVGQKCAWIGKRSGGTGCDSGASTALEALMSPMETEQRSEFEWREAVIDLARAQRAYAEITATPDVPDILVNRVWLWLWRAERRRDELLNAQA